MSGPKKRLFRPCWIKVKLTSPRAKVEKKLERSPGDPGLLFTRALVADREGDDSTAVAIYSALIKTHPAMIEPYNNLAIHHARNGDYNEAVSVLEKGLQSNPALATTFGNPDSPVLLDSQATHTVRRSIPPARRSHWRWLHWTSWGNPAVIHCAANPCVDALPA